MQITGPEFLKSLLTFFLFLAPFAHALKLTKKTVLESIFLNTAPPRATWNDSLSLVNTTDDTVFMKAIYFKVPQGKLAHLQIGYKVPYHTVGVFEGPVLRSGQPYSFFLYADKVILPRGRVPITGFRMNNCIECPVGGGGSTTGSLDTITTYVIFDTKISLDTLIVIGDIESTPSGIISAPQPFRLRKSPNQTSTNEWGSYNGLGRIISSQQGDASRPMIMQFYDGEPRK